MHIVISPSRLLLPPFISYPLLVLKNWGERASGDDGSNGGDGISSSSSSSSGRSIDMLPPWSLHPVPLPLPPCLSSWGWQGSSSCLLDFELAGAAAVGACSRLLSACAWRSRDGAREAADALAAECLRLRAILESVPLLQRQHQQQITCVDLSFLLPASPMSSWPAALQVICYVMRVCDV